MTTPVFTGTQRRFFSFALAFILAGLAAMACSARGNPSRPQESASLPPGAAPQSLTRGDGGQAGVTVEATWVNEAHRETLPPGSLADYPADRYALVHLKLDTHSENLAGYDLTGLATLRWQDREPTGAVVWLGIEEASHHREGVLAFPGPSVGQGTAELRLRGIAGVAERVLRWDF